MSIVFAAPPNRNYALFQKFCKCLLADQDFNLETIFIDVSTLNGLLQAIEQQSPRLLLVSKGFCKSNGLTLPKLATISKDAGVVLMSQLMNDGDRRETFELGFQGYFPLNLSFAHLSNGLDLVLSGQDYFPPGLKKKESRPAQPTPTHVKAKTQFTNGISLTKRQAEILLLIENGKQNKEIALYLELSPSTVKLHVNNIFRKLGVSNRMQAVGKAQSIGLL